MNRGVTILHSRPIVARPNCCSSKINTHQLRAQLDQLHTESDTTRAKADSARLRLLRLSEAAEKLKRQAAVNLHTGKENDARELLFQKKKVVQAMENSKHRIELLDELAAKLNEAISVKETQLIGNVALDLEVDREDPSRLVRIVSPKQKVEEGANEDKDSEPNALKLGDTGNQVMQFFTDSRAIPLIDKDMNDCQGSLGVEIGVEENTISSLRGISSFSSFLEHLDQQLNNIEAELVTILNVSTLILNDKEKPKNLKVQQAIELLESIRGIREKVASFMSSVAEIS
ncbi:hypothetical protein LWI28_002279 [Acer negundo]|uniref:Uncharacterized protein n=1 Tax=Acer negundo TaxID=4023 RepID=A0AAD5NRB3_ACENE|nr:hypothetical protein LWI28_002279 [Acer negundo]KAK4845257.1 hypothetical protein QYF36_002892 [Acer negundo]